RPAITGLGRDFLASRAAHLVKSGLQDQVFRRIAGNKKFGEHHDVRAKARSLLAGLPKARAIARDVANRAIDLREANDQAVRWRIVHKRLICPLHHSAAAASARRRSSRSALISSARRKATSIACSALSLGSQ